MKVVVTEDDISRGVPRSGQHCPIARAISNQYGYVFNVDRFMATFVHAGSPSFIVHAELPLEANEFIERFDNGQAVEPFEFEFVKSIFGVSEAWYGSV